MSTHLPLLLVDIGNTRLNWRWVVGAAQGHGDVPIDGLIAIDELRAQASARAPLQSLWAAAHAQSQASSAQGLALMSCVAEESMATAALQAAQALGLRAHRVRTVARAAGVSNGYAQPERLGVDRWLGLIAAHEMAMAQAADEAGGTRPPGPLVVAGVGTALTLDVLAADGTHRGGLLVPGPALMADTLLQRTARIAANAGQDEPLVQAGLGRNTRGALQAGAWLAAAAVTERVVREAGATTLVLTGGGAEGVAERLLPNGDAGVDGGAAAYRVEPVPDLVLRGLARVARGLLQGEADCGMMTA